MATIAGAASLAFLTGGALGAATGCVLDYVFEGTVDADSMLVTTGIGAVAGTGSGAAVSYAGLCIGPHETPLTEKLTKGQGSEEL